MTKTKEKCVFCGKPAPTTREHVFPKCFFDKPYPNNLPTVSSCAECNNSYSEDEQYLMYLIDYLKSIEINNGEFTRNKSKEAFNHNQSLENRMINSIRVEDGGAFFEYEKDRITNVINKIARCMYLYYEKVNTLNEQLECKWIFRPQLTTHQMNEIDRRVNFSVIQEGTVEYYSSSDEIGFCISKFFYGCATIKR